MRYTAISAIAAALCFFSLFVPVADAVSFASIDFSLAAMVAASPYAKRCVATIALGGSAGVLLLCRGLTHVYFCTPVDVARVIVHFVR